MWGVRAGEPPDRHSQTAKWPEARRAPARQVAWRAKWLCWGASAREDLCLLEGQVAHGQVVSCQEAPRQTRRVRDGVTLVGKVGWGLVGEAPHLSPDRPVLAGEPRG